MHRFHFARRNTEMNLLGRRTWALRVAVGYWPCLEGPFFQVGIGYWLFDFWFGKPSYLQTRKAVG